MTLNVAGLRLFTHFISAICDFRSLKNGVVNKIFSLSAKFNEIHFRFASDKVTFRRFNASLRRHCRQKKKYN